MVALVVRLAGAADEARGHRQIVLEDVVREDVLLGVPLVELDLLQRGHVEGRDGDLETVEVRHQRVAHPPQRRLLVDAVPHLMPWAYNST